MAESDGSKLMDDILHKGRAIDVDRMREAMGTAPDTNVELITPIFEGVKGIKVELYDACVNPYKAMFNMATSTWGKHIDKWPDVSPENRFAVVKALLEFKALPSAMEHPVFCFGVERCSRSAFDQIARARIGVVFSSMGWRDNDHSDIGFRIPQAIYDSEHLPNVIEALEHCKSIYHELVKSGQANWQDARAVIPISAIHRFSMSINYLALRNFCNKRLKFCEQADTVAVAWLMRKRVLEAFPLLGSYLRPSCDGRGVCEYHQSYSMSEAFGCLFKACGRNPEQGGQDEYATFNNSCTDAKTLSEQLGIKIPGPKEDLPPKSWEDLKESDRDLLCS